MIYDYFSTLKLLNKDNKVFIVNGSGVNIEKFSPTSTKGKQLTFILIARLIKDKGIEEFVEATRILKRKFPWVKCKILGPLDSNPTSISKEKVELWIQ